MNFSKTDIQAIISDTVSWLGAKPTEDQVRSVLENDKTGLAEAIWYDFELVGHPDKYGMDTAVRDIWANLVAKVMTGSDWPTYGEAEGDFFEKLDRGYAKNGWQTN